MSTTASNTPDATAQPPTSGDLHRGAYAGHIGNGSAPPERPPRTANDFCRLAFLTVDDPATADIERVVAIARAKAIQEGVSVKIDRQNATQMRSKCKMKYGAVTHDNLRRMQADADRKPPYKPPGTGRGKAAPAPPPTTPAPPDPATGDDVLKLLHLFRRLGASRARAALDLFEELTRG